MLDFLCVGISRLKTRGPFDGGLVGSLAAARPGLVDARHSSSFEFFHYILI